MKKYLKTISIFSTLTAIVAPLATVVSCNEKDGKFSSAVVKESDKTDEDILNEIVTSTFTSRILTGGNDAPKPVVKEMIENFRDTGYNYDLDPTKWDTPEKLAAMQKCRDFIEQNWNTPQGEMIRLAHITTMLAKNIWGIRVNNGSSAVIDGILQGISSAGFSASEKLNIFKLRLINNIRKAVEATNSRASLRKFEGFIEWMTNPENEYANLKLTLMGDEINSDFMYGVQTALNYNEYAENFVDVFKMDTTSNKKIVSLTPEQTQWIKDIQNSPELASVKADTKESIVKLFADSDDARLDFANALINDLPGPWVTWRTKIITAAIGAIWEIPAKVALTGLERAVLSVAPMATEIKTHIADVEKTNLDTLDEFINFVKGIKSKDNNYAFIKNLLNGAGAKDEDIKRIQARLNDGKDKTGAVTLTPLVPASVSPKIDIYA